MRLNGILAAICTIGGIPLQVAAFPANQTSVSKVHNHTINTGNKTIHSLHGLRPVTGYVYDEGDPHYDAMADNDIALCYNQGSKVKRYNYIHAIDHEVCKGIGRPFVSQEQFSWYYTEPYFIITLNIGTGQSYDPGANQNMCRKNLRKIVDMCDIESDNGKQGGILFNVNEPWTWFIDNKMHGHLQNLLPCDKERCLDKFWNGTGPGGQ